MVASRLQYSLLVSVALAALVAAPVFAVTVPDDYPTIQAALDSGADQVIVKQGVYPEHLVLHCGVELLAYGDGNWYSPTAPVVAGLSFGDLGFNCGHSQECVIRGIHFTGSVSLDPAFGLPKAVSFESCRMDSGMTQIGYSADIELEVVGCEIFGSVTLDVVHHALFQMNTVIGGGISLISEGDHSILSNFILGPAPFGVRSGTNGGNPPIRDNTIIGTTDGMQISDYATLENNDIHDCLGSGVTSSPVRSEFNVRMTGNSIRRCASSGVSFVGPASIGGNVHGCTLVDNAIEDIGLDGIRISNVTGATIIGNTVRHCGGYGVRLDSSIAARLQRNQVTHAAIDGMLLGVAAFADSNVIGRSTGRGLVMLGGGSAHNNTVYLNGAAGMDIHGTGTADSVDHNISYGNFGYGLKWTGSSGPTLGCNDWYGNLAGATSGVLPGASDLSVLPLFCDLAADSVSLSSASPLLNAAGCGQIGALGLGCSQALAVGPGEMGPPRHFTAWPLPSRGSVWFSWGDGTSAKRVELYDVSGARRWAAEIGAGSNQVRWNGRDETGRTVGPGVFYVRLRGANSEAVTKVVLIP